MTARIQENKLLDIRTTIELIQGGRVLVVSGEDRLMEKLPRGNWIGGTTPYFYLKNERGRADKSKLFVTDFTESINDFKILTLEEESLAMINTIGFENGFSFLILPAGQKIHHAFAIKSKDYDTLKNNSLIGFVAGADLEEYKKGKVAKLFNGETKQSFSNSAVVMYCSLISPKVARVGSVNIFEPSHEFFIEVFEDTAKVKDCLINGELSNLYQFLKDNKIDVSHPLIFDQGHSNVNISFQFLIKESKEVFFFAPLMKGKKYYFSKRLDHYQSAIKTKLFDVVEHENAIIYNCSSILNYVHGKLNKNGIGFSGPVTFGEIANHLLNQTFTYLAIDEL
jgi:hypothetical protein